MHSYLVMMDLFELWFMTEYKYFNCLQDYCLKLLNIFIMLSFITIAMPSTWKINIHG